MYQEPIINFAYLLNWLYASFFCFIVNGQKRSYKPSNIEFDYLRDNQTHDCPVIRIYCDIPETEYILAIDFDGVKTRRHYKPYPNSCKDYKEFGMTYDFIESMDALVSKKIPMIPKERGYKIVLDIPCRNIEPHWWIDVSDDE